MIPACKGCGACCKVLTFKIDPKAIDEKARYFYEKTRGVKIIGEWLVIPSKCVHLTEQNECGLWEKPERPQVCSEFPRGSPPCIVSLKAHGTNTTNGQ